MRLYNPRWTPEGKLVEITNRTPMGIYLIVPTPGLNEIIRGVFGHAQQETGFKAHALHVASSHFHLLATMESTRQMAETMHLIDLNFSKEVHKYIGDKLWPGHLWEGPYHHVPVTDEENVQIARLRYVLEQATDACLVDRPCQWPGVHSVDALLSGEPLRGTWYDRTKEWAAWQRGEKRTYPEAVELHFSPLPCWAHLPEAEVRSRVAGQVADIEEKAEATRIEKKRVPKTLKQIEDLTKISRRRRPENFEPSPQPLVHGKEQLKEFYFTYSEIKRVYRDAAEKLASGDLSAEFPEGTYPPGLPYVSAPRPP